MRSVSEKSTTIQGSNGDVKCKDHYLTIETQKKKSLNLGQTQTEMNSIFKICNPNSITNETIRLFLIKADTLNLQEQNQEMERKGTSDLEITYFSSNEALARSELDDMKISYEFLTFDWTDHVKHSICDFEHSAEMKASGSIRNPQASIFYRSDSGDQKRTLNCKYRIRAKPNQYIKLTFEKVDFKLNKCENFYFAKDHQLKREKCEKLARKLKVKDSKYSDSTSILHDEGSSLCVQVESH